MKFATRGRKAWCAYKLLTAIFLDWQHPFTAFHLEGHEISYVINALCYPTYVQLFYGEYDPEGRYDESRVTHMEIRIRYDNLAKLPPRRFAPPCRSLCGFDLHRWHVTCVFSCLLRRVHYGKMPAKIPVEGYVLWIHKGRRFERVTQVLLKRVMTIAEQLAKL